MVDGKVSRRGFIGAAAAAGALAVGAGLAGFLGSATNTVLVLSSAFLLFNDQLNMTFKALIASIIATNSIAEAIASTILTASIVPILIKFRN